MQNHSNRILQKTHNNWTQVDYIKFINSLTQWVSYQSALTVQFGNFWIPPHKTSMGMHMQIFSFPTPPVSFYSLLLSFYFSSSFYLYTSHDLFSLSLYPYSSHVFLLSLSFYPYSSHIFFYSPSLSLLSDSIVDREDLFVYS